MYKIWDMPDASLLTRAYRKTGLHEGPFVREAGRAIDTLKINMKTSREKKLYRNKALSKSIYQYIESRSVMT